MKKLLLIGLGITLAACMQTPTGGTQSLSGKALEAKFSGKKMQWTMAGAVNKIDVTFYPDGTGYGISGDDRRDMEWEIEGTAVCIDDPGRLGDPEDCAQVYWTGPNSIRLVRTSKSGQVMEILGRYI